MFQLVSKFKPKGDQPEAIIKLVANINSNQKQNILFGATGTGKTFTIANVIEKLQQNVLVISHNKTLAIQLFSELKTFFPKNRVEYFISPFDFYQPEAYLPERDIYIDKSVKWNLDIRKMRMNALNALLSHESTIVVATVASIFGVINPNEYYGFILALTVGQTYTLDKLNEFLLRSGYKFNELLNDSSQFRIQGNVLTISLSHNDHLLRIVFDHQKIKLIHELHPVTYKLIKRHEKFTLYPGNEYVVEEPTIQKAIASIKQELKTRLDHFAEIKNLVASYRLQTRTNKDLEDLMTQGYCKGIENYSLHFDGRKPGIPPYTILDYFTFFTKNFLTIIDESHITVPQISGMYWGNRSRKKNLIDYGFRLPTAYDNRPLTFQEFEKKLSNVIYASATPGTYELDEIKGAVVEQLIRPTGLLDPIVEIHKTNDQIDHLILEIQKEVARKNRVFVLTLTIKMAEELTRFLQLKGIKVAYIHNQLKTFERTKVLINLRKQIFDVVVGINLLREGLDIPEVALVAILDADKTGFLRGSKSLIQMIGRASRNQDGRVILYADAMTTDMKIAISETTRRRKLQLAYNKKHQITPKTIIKPIDDIFMEEDIAKFYAKIQTKKGVKISKEERVKMIKLLNEKMANAVKRMDFDLAAKIRDMIFELMKIEW